MKRLFIFSNKWLIGYLTFISAFAPLSTDMYLPALPHMVTSLATDYAKASLSVSGFLLIFALSMLIWGPLSDKYGRRPVLLGGSLVYVFASVAIALASSIVPLLCWRALQALGSGAVSAMALAIVKDMLRGQALEQVVAWMQTVMVLAPILAPVLGSWILLAVDWRGIFWMLAFCGLLSFLGALGFRETCLPAHRNRGSVFSALGRLFVVLGHPEFRWPLLLFSAMNMPFMAYLAVSSYVFQTLFGLSPQHYSLFFAGNAAMGMLGPLAHMRFFRHWQRRLTIAVHLGLSGVCGILLCLFGGAGPVVFAALYAPITFCGSALRPPGTVLMMESVQGDNGAVTSLINAGGLLCGSLSMFLCALPFWRGLVYAAGSVTVLISGLSLLGWLAMLRLGIVRKRRQVGLPASAAAAKHQDSTR